MLFGVFVKTMLTINTDLSIIVSSLSGAIVYMLARHHFSRRTKPLMFFISFIMGVCGADFTLELVKAFIPGVFGDNEKAVGAFICSALVVTVILGIMRRIDIILKGHEE
ncbi:putative holin [Klebsiella variicola]